VILILSTAKQASNIKRISFKTLVRLGDGFALPPWRSVMKKRILLFVVLVTLLGVVASGVMASPMTFQSPVEPPPLPELSPELLATIAGTALSLALSYIPGLNVGYAGLNREQKQLIMLGLLVLASVGILGLACTPVLGLVIVECSATGAVRVVTVLIAALIANQGVHSITPEASAVRKAKARAAGPKG